MTTEVKVTEADRQAALKFMRDWDGSDSIRHALAALLAQTRLAERERIVSWLRSQTDDRLAGNMFAYEIERDHEGEGR